MASNEPVRAQLTSVLKEPMKMFRVYDGSNRVQYQYECVANTVDQGPCMRTEYVYDGASTRVVKFLETEDVWDSATMDI